jgi:DNA-binding MarR family transcriptional regulator
METLHPDLTFNELRILMRVGEQPGVTQRELVEHSHADKALMTRTLTHLEERGWIKRSASENDKRVRCLNLNTRGKRIFTQLRSLQEQVAAEMLQGCPPPLQAQLLAMLQQARNSARDHED